VTLTFLPLVPIPPDGRTQNRSFPHFHGLALPSLIQIPLRNLTNNKEGIGSFPTVVLVPSWRRMRDILFNLFTINRLQMG